MSMLLYSYRAPPDSGCRLNVSMQPEKSLLIKFPMCLPFSQVCVKGDGVKAIVMPVK